MSDSDSWCSPPEICDPLADFFGGPVDVDPCSNDRSIVQATLALTRGGLVLPWKLPRSRRGRGSAYMNEPYSKSSDWTDKALAELASGNVDELVRLTMTSTSARWWARMCTEPARNPRVMALKRIKFLRPPGLESPDPNRALRRVGCRFEPALFYIGPNPDRFVKTFNHLINWMTWGRT